jgi:hypothetical protein
VVPKDADEALGAGFWPAEGQQKMGFTLW